MFKTVYFIALH